VLQQQIDELQGQISVEDQRVKSLLNKRLAATEVKPSDTLKGTKDTTKAMDSSEYVFSCLRRLKFFLFFVFDISLICYGVCVNQCAESDGEGKVACRVE
jgi:hypothetical protein